MIDILSIEPNKVSKNINTYSYLFYGVPKIGKTTIATKFPKTLLVAPEKGYKSIPGVKPAPINNWGEFVNIVNQLIGLADMRERAAIKGEKYEMPYETIAIDVVDILYNYCTKFILQRENANSLKDIPHGAGYGMIEKEFDEKLQTIVSCGYGLILLSHAQDSFTDEDTGVTKQTLTMEKRCKKICTRLVDLYGFLTKATDSEGNEARVILTEDNPYGDAGNRIDHLPPVIPLNYEALEKAIITAIELKEKEINDNSLFTEDKINFYRADDVKDVDFEALRKEIVELIGELMANSENKDSTAARIRGIIQKNLGVGVVLEQATESHTQHLILIRDAIKAIK